MLCLQRQLIRCASIHLSVAGVESAGDSGVLEDTQALHFGRMVNDNTAITAGLQRAGSRG